MATDTATASAAGAHVEQDEVYWTELEFRRLGNMVAEMIQARRYTGDRAAARAERALMRTRVNAMRRKALRVLVRAELYAKSSHRAWPGLDPSLTEPVSLAEEYVRTVSNYDAVLTEEEDRALHALRDDFDIGGVRAAADARAEVGHYVHADVGVGDDDKNGDRAGMDGLLGRKGIEDISYREALARDAAERTDADKRSELLGGQQGSPSKGPQETPGPTSRYYGTDETLMAAHLPVQDQLTSDLIDLVGRLKGSMTEINTRIVQDGQIIDETENAVDKNISAIGKQRENLDSHSRYSSLSWWTIYSLIFLVFVVFISVFALTKIPI
jgi:hypothetical protein